MPRRQITPLEPLEPRVLLSGSPYDQDNPPPFDLRSNVADSLVRLPKNVISGTNRFAEFPIWVKNQGEETTPADATVNVQVFGRWFDEAGEKHDIAVGRVEGLPLGRALAPGRSVLITAPFDYPKEMETEQYVFNAWLEADNFDERNKHNNIAFITRKHAVNVTQGFYELDAKLSETKYGRYQIDGLGKKGRVKVDITNSGTLVIPRSQTADIRVVARPVGAQDEAQDIELTTLRNKRFFGIKPGESFEYIARFAMPEGIDPGAYQVITLVDPEDNIDERDDDNRLVSKQWMQVDAMRLDLAAEIPTLNLPDNIELDDAGFSTESFDIPVELTNAGNVKFAPGQEVKVEVWGNLIPRFDGADNPSYARKQYRIGKGEYTNIESLRPGQTMTVNVESRMYNFMAEGDWRITAFVDAERTLAEADETNNGGITDEIAIVNHDVAFAADDRSMWGLGGPARFDTGKLFSGFTWDKTAKSGTLDVWAASAQLYARTKGKVGVDFQAILDSGSVDLGYQNTIAMSILDAGTEDGYTIMTAPVGDPSGKLVTRSPQIDIESNLIFELYARAGARGQVFGKKYDKGITFANVKEKFTLLKVNSSEITVLGETLAEADPGEDTIDVEIDMQIDISSGKPKPEPKIVEKNGEKKGSKAKKKPHKTNPLKDIDLSFSAGDVTLTWPEVNTTERAYRGWDGSFGSITSSGKTDFVDIDVDLDFLATALTPMPPVGASASLGPVSVSADLIDVDFGPTFGFAQTFKFDPRPMTTLDFGKDVEVWDGSGWTMTDTFTTHVGEPVHLKTPDPSLEVAATYTLDNQFRSQTDLTVAPELTLEALKFRGEAFGYTIADLTAYSKSWRGAETKLASVFDKTFTVDGFNEVQAQGSTIALSKRTDTKLSFTNPDPQPLYVTYGDGDDDPTRAPGETASGFPG